MTSPYESLLQTLQFVEPYLQSIDDAAAAERPAPGKWSKKEIIGHLIDSATNNQQKFVRARTAPEGSVSFVGYAQDDWVAVQHYGEADWGELLRLWKSLNLHLAHVMKNMEPAYYGNTIYINGEGPFRLDFIMADYVEHLKHHLKAVIPEAGLESSFINLY